MKFFSLVFLTTRQPLLILVLSISASVAGEVHSEHCLYGCPSGSPVSNDLIVRPIYALSSNDTTNLADWVAYKVDQNNLGPSRKRKWYTDPVLDNDETLEAGDYKGAHANLHTDRGHQVPLASFAGTPYWEMTNYLSNITPQKSALNQGPWKNLEEAERDLARQGEVVYVMSGPIYGDSDIPLPGADEPTEMPEAYWKVVSVETDTGVRTASFLMPQEAARRDDFCKYVTHLEEIESLSGLSFFHAANYPDERHEQLNTLSECRAWLR